MTGADLVIILIAVTAGAALKSLTGMGLPAIGIPTIALFVGIEEAVAVVSLPNFISNAAIAVRERSSSAETRDLPVLAGTGVVGAIAGALLFVSVPEEPLVVMLLIAVVGFVLAFFAKPRSAMSPQTSARWAPLVGAVGGLFQGSIGISGPIVASWIHSYRLPKNAQVLSLTVLFLLTGFAQFVVFLFSGSLAGLWLPSALACIPALATVPIGGRLRDRINTRSFDYLVLFAITLAGLGLGWRTFV